GSLITPTSASSWASFSLRLVSIGRKRGSLCLDFNPITDFVDRRSRKPVILNCTGFFSRHQLSGGCEFCDDITGVPWSWFAGLRERLFQITTRKTLFPLVNLEPITKNLRLGHAGIRVRLSN